MHVIAFLCWRDSMHMEDPPAMSNFEKQTTAAGNAISPAAVAMTKCPPLFERDTQAHTRVLGSRRRRKPAISPRSSATTVASRGRPHRLFPGANLSRDKPDPPIA